MKPSTKLARIITDLCDLFEKKYGKKMNKNVKVNKKAVKRKYTKRVEIVAPITIVKRGRGRPRKDGTVPIVTVSNVTTPAAPVVVKCNRGRPRKNPIVPIPMTPEALAKIEAIKAQIAKLSATIPADRGE